MIKPPLPPPALEVYPETGMDAAAHQDGHRSPGSPAESANRLLVLIPVDADYTALTHQVWKLANETQLRVRLLGLCKVPAEEPALRRQLATLSALIGDGRICADSRIEVGRNWANLVRNNYLTGDVIVCQSGQRLGMLHRPMDQILEANLNAPVYLLLDLHPGKSGTNRIAQIAVWLGFMAIIIGCGIFQAQIVQSTEGRFQDVLLILSVLLEFRLIWVWNSFYG